MRLFQLGLLVVFLGIVGCVGVAPAKIKVEMCACKDAQCGPTQGAECSSKR